MSISERFFLKQSEKFKEKQALWERKKSLLIQEKQLKEEMKSFKKPIPTAKKLILFLFINCSVIEIFTGYVTLKSFKLAEVYGGSVDFSPLVALIGAVVGEVIGFAIYALKSMRENCANGIVYETAMRDYGGDEPNG